MRISPTTKVRGQEYAATVVAAWLAGACSSDELRTHKATFMEKDEAPDDVKELAAELFDALINDVEKLESE